MERLRKRLIGFLRGRLEGRVDDDPPRLRVAQGDVPEVVPAGISTVPSPRRGRFWGEFELGALGPLGCSAVSSAVITSIMAVNVHKELHTITLSISFSLPFPLCKAGVGSKVCGLLDPGTIALRRTLLN